MKKCNELVRVTTWPFRNMYNEEKVTDILSEIWITYSLKINGLENFKFIEMRMSYIL
jgi:hypothetical protein